MSDTDVDLREVMKGFKNMERVLDKYGRELFTETAKDIKADMREQKRDGRGALGSAWAPRSGESRSRAKRGGKRRKKSARTGLLGKLPSAWSSQVDRDGVEMTNRVPFATAHHTGATVGRGATLPARPHLDVNPQRVEDVVEAIRDLAVEAFKGKR